MRVARPIARGRVWTDGLSSRRASVAAVSALFAVSAYATPASAFRVELKDVAPDRIERQRAEAIGQLPLPGTPNVAQFEQRLKDKGLALGNPIFLRTFKAESELEVWMQKGDRFELFAVYPICHWSGTLGPKLNEGDKQTPEGIYTVSSRQVHASGRHPKALNLGFPNSLDKQFQRTGSYILIHGGCGSIGCFAMTNPVIDEIYILTQAALKNGQDLLHVHTFPFRLTENKLSAYALHEWYDFWRNLKDVHDAFERTKRPPKVSVCEGRYWVEPSGEVASQGPLAVCGAPQQVAASSSDPTDSASTLLSSDWMARLRPKQVPSLLANPESQGPMVPEFRNPGPNRALQMQARRNGVGPSGRLAGTSQPLQGPQTGQPSIPVRCNATLASCRKWIALQTTAAVQRSRAARAVAAQTRPAARRGS